MFARVTQFDIDLMRIDITSALARFKEMVMPALRNQPGYEGGYLLNTARGHGLLVTLWADVAAAEAGVASGYYDEQIRKFVTFYREPPGREHYEVIWADVPATSDSRSGAGW
jgi:heme-degrading monooxygenase HmoA